MDKAIKLNVKITDKVLINAFISACEGGSNYWCRELTPLGKNKDAYHAMLGGWTLIDGTDGKKHVVSPEKIAKGVKLLGEKHPAVLASFLTENDDANDADLLLQLITFGKVIYG